MNKENIVLPTNIHIDRFDIDVRPYLTLADVAIIAEEMMVASDWCQMEIALNTNILRCCVINAEEFDGMDYETLKHSGVFRVVKDCIENIDDIDEYICAKTSNATMLGEFLKEFVKIADKAQKKLPKASELQDIIGQAQSLMQK